jgi:uncharacterized membrane protein YdcZ (DUF606 family)
MGWMGVIQRQITATRMCGVALLLLGVWLIHRDN